MDRMENTHITSRQLVKDNTRSLRLRIVAGNAGLDSLIGGIELHRPGLVLTGFVKGFPEDRVQLFGDTESFFLKQLSPEKQKEALTRLFTLKIPCVIVTSRNRILPIMKQLAEKYSIPVITSSRPSSDVAFLFTNYLNQHFTPTESIHGTLVDVYGTGLLFIGRAAIGKSEIALDLVERGHRLVADDIVNLTLKPPDVLTGSSPEMLKHLIEIRGVGIINVKDVFGVRAIRLQKRIETVVKLEEWDNREDYERLGLDEQSAEYLGIKIPLIRLPIFPGKNITVIAETIALNLHLKVYGVHTARDLHKKLLKNLKQKKKIADYLKYDRE